MNDRQNISACSSSRLAPLLSDPAGPALVSRSESMDEISWDQMRSDEIKAMRYLIRSHEISDEIA